MEKNDDSEEDKHQTFSKRISAIKERIKMYMDISNVVEIGRRYFVMNAFDGALTMLGFIIGTYVSGNLDARLIISAGIGASLAMGLSGFAGAYITEKAERAHTLRKIEEDLMEPIGDSITAEASTFASLVAAFIDGVSPALAALVSIIPFVFSLFNLLPVLMAFYIAVSSNLILIFALGVYLSTISKERWWVYGIVMALVGLITVFLTILLTGGSVL